MPAAPLSVDKPLNPRQELFAQALARGMSQRAAYLAAGYKDARNPWAVMQKPNVQARIEELLDETAALNRITIDSITQRLQTLARRNETADSVAAQSLARRALMDLARMHGLMTPKAAPSPPVANPIPEFRRVIVYPDGYQTDYSGNPLDPRRPPYDPSFRYKPLRDDDG